MNESSHVKSSIVLLQNVLIKKSRDSPQKSYSFESDEKSKSKTKNKRKLRRTASWYIDEKPVFSDSDEEMQYSKNVLINTNKTPAKHGLEVQCNPSEVKIMDIIKECSIINIEDVREDFKQLINLCKQLQFKYVLSLLAKKGSEHYENTDGLNSSNVSQFTSLSSPENNFLDEKRYHSRNSTSDFGNINISSIKKSQINKLKENHVRRSSRTQKRVTPTGVFTDQKPYKLLKQIQMKSKANKSVSKEEKKDTNQLRAKTRAYERKSYDNTKDIFKDGKVDKKSSDLSPSSSENHFLDQESSHTISFDSGFTNNSFSSSKSNESKERVLRKSSRIRKPVKRNGTGVLIVGKDREKILKRSQTRKKTKNSVTAKNKSSPSKKRNGSSTAQANAKRNTEDIDKVLSNLGTRRKIEIDQVRTKTRASEKKASNDTVSKDTFQNRKSISKSSSNVSSFIPSSPESHFSGHKTLLPLRKSGAMSSQNNETREEELRRSGRVRKPATRINSGVFIIGKNRNNFLKQSQKAKNVTTKRKSSPPKKLPRDIINSPLVLGRKRKINTDQLPARTDARSCQSFPLQPKPKTRRLFSPRRWQQSEEIIELGDSVRRNTLS